MANLVGLERTASEEAITERLVSNMRLANAVKMRANEGGRLDPAIREMVNAIAGEGVNFSSGSNIYATPTLGADTEDESPTTTALAARVESTRPGYFQLYLLRPDGKWQKDGPEMYGSDVLKSKAAAINAKARAKGTKANERTIHAMVANEMQRSGKDWTASFCQIRKDMPHLFLGMRDPAPRQRAQFGKRK